MSDSDRLHPVRAVVDSNIVVRAILSATGGAAYLWQVLKRKQFIPVTSHRQLSEIHRALGYPRIARKYAVTDSTRKRTVAQLYSRSVIVSPSSLPRVCRDVNDDYLVANAILGAVGYLVTEDKDLLEDPPLARALERRGVETVTLAEFLHLLRTR